MASGPEATDPTSMYPSVLRRSARPRTTIGCASAMRTRSGGGDLVDRMASSRELLTWQGKARAEDGQSKEYSLLEFRVCGARLRQRSLFDRDVYGSWRAVDVDLSRWSCGGAVHGRACTTSRAGFLVGCGREAEGLDIAEPAGKRVLDQARRQRRRPAPATDPQQREHLRLRPRGQ